MTKEVEITDISPEELRSEMAHLIRGVRQGTVSARDCDASAKAGYVVVKSHEVGLLTRLQNYREQIGPRAIQAA